MTGQQETKAEALVRWAARRFLSFGMRRFRDFCEPPVPGFVYAQNTTQWSIVGRPHATDREIMEWGKAHDHVVFTHDLDFGILMARTQDAGPRVIRIRILDTFPEAAGFQLVPAIRTYEAYRN